MRSSNIPVRDFKSICDGYLNKVRSENITPGLLIKDLSYKFNISEEWVCKRFKSYYGTTIAEKIKEIGVPSREEFTLAILKSDNVAELWKNLNLRYSFRKGLFDKYYKVSNFEKAKAICLSYIPKIKYEPSIYENASLVFSQVLGDGSYNKVRGALVISHGENQFDYLFYKAGLFNKAFPTSKPAGNTKLMLHHQGHKYSTWYSGRLPSKLTEKIENSTPSDLIKELTPFGMFLLFLDDGYMNFDIFSGENTFVQIFMMDESAITTLKVVLNSFNIKPTISRRAEGGFYLKVGTMESAMLFYKSFVEPFKDGIPECMRYKTELKI